MDAETIKKNEEIIKKKKAALEAERNAKAKEAADKAPAGKAKKDAKKAGKKKWLSYYECANYFQLIFSVILMNQYFVLQGYGF